MAELDVAINPSAAVRGGNVVKQIMRDIKDAASGMNGSVVNFGSTMGRVMGTGPALFVTGVGAMAIAAVAATKATAAHIAEIQKLALTTNLSTREAQMFAAMAKQTGTDLSGLSGGMSKLNENLQEAAKGSGESQRVFGALGISVKDTNGQVRGTGKVFEEVVSRLGEFKDDSAKTTIISKLLGDEMQQMARVGKEGFQSLSNEARLMNAILGEDSVQAAEKFNQHIARTSTILEAWKLSIGEHVLPYVNKLLEAMNKFATGRDLPAMPETGSASGKKSLVMPADPGQLRSLSDAKSQILVKDADAQIALESKTIQTITKLWQDAFDQRSITERQMVENNFINQIELIDYQIRMTNGLKRIEAERLDQSLKYGGLTKEQIELLKEQSKARQQDLDIQKTALSQQALNAQKEHMSTLSVVGGREQTTHGTTTTDALISNFQIETDLRHRAQDDTQTYYQNLLKFQEAYGTSRENMMTTEFDLVRANLAKQLDVNQETAEKVLNAWRNNDHIHAAELLDGTQKTWDQVTAIMMGAMADQRAVSEKYSDDLFEGFAKSMRRYVNDQSVFGLGADQARRVAQGMEQAFGKFFFDGMEGRIKSFKDVVTGLTDFAKNILADVSSKLTTRMILGGFDMLMSGGGGSIGGLIGGAGDVGGFALRGHARGGISNVPAIFGEAGPEAAVPLPDGRSIPVTLKGMPYGNPGGMVSTQVHVNVQVENHSDAAVSVERGPVNKNGVQDIKVLIHQTVQQGMRDGVYDQSMKQFGANRQAARR
ncbi:MAG: hypothetical protein HRU82_03410 [Nitrospira sp.]|nr:MAG: hypothetical protein HRU82_03410 [Nitrospira sp.]